MEGKGTRKGRNWKTEMEEKEGRKRKVKRGKKMEEKGRKWESESEWESEKFVKKVCLKEFSTREEEAVQPPSSADLQCRQGRVQQRRPPVPPSSQRQAEGKHNIRRKENKENIQKNTKTCFENLYAKYHVFQNLLKSRRSIQESRRAVCSLEMCLVMVCG